MLVPSRFPRSWDMNSACSTRMRIPHYPRLASCSQIFNLHKRTHPKAIMFPRALVVLGPIKKRALTKLIVSPNRGSPTNLASGIVSSCLPYFPPRIGPRHLWFPTSTITSCPFSELSKDITSVSRVQPKRFDRMVHEQRSPQELIPLCSLSPRARRGSFPPLP